MTELRWATRVGKNVRAGPYTVLEYRVQKADQTSEWSVWRKVPTVFLGRPKPQHDEGTK